MSENKHTVSDLYQMQSLPLDAKVRMTCVRIRGWIDEYGEDGVYVSFSGGKDSTVLLDLVRNVCGFKNVPAVFVDVPTQYPELRDFAKTFENVEIIKPKINFMEVCEKYGFPLISKEVSESVAGARKYLKLYEEQIEKEGNQNLKMSRSDLLTKIHMESIENDEKHQYNYETDRICGFTNKNLKNAIKNGKYTYGIPVRLLIMEGKYPHKEKGVMTDEFSSRYDRSRYKFFLDAPFEISNQCCMVMKKKPVHKYSKDTGRMPITGQMADESQLRLSHWLKNGCNGFNMKNPVSNPLSFWTENDILEYIYTRKLPICSVYGDVVIDYNKMDEIEGQIKLVDDGKKPIYKTTGCDRTGCMLCGFGCHINHPGEKSRFERLKETHPKMYNLLDICKNNGVTFREAIEWTNEHGDLNIRL